VAIPCKLINVKITIINSHQPLVARSTKINAFKRINIHDYPLGLHERWYKFYIALTIDFFG
jgi:hypothetical protein